jgi:hypothetical protein
MRLRVKSDTSQKRSDPRQIADPSQPDPPTKVIDHLDISPDRNGDEDELFGAYAACRRAGGRCRRSAHRFAERLQTTASRRESHHGLTCPLLTTRRSGLGYPSFPRLPTLKILRSTSCVPSLSFLPSLELHVSVDPLLGPAVAAERH